MSDGLDIWVIYDHPADYPDHFVARLHVLHMGAYKPTTRHAINTELDKLRGQMERLGLVCLTRSPEDEPQIVETWI